MTNRDPLARMPTELLYYVCDYLPFLDVARLRYASNGQVHDIVHRYMMDRAVMSTTHPLRELATGRQADCIELLVGHPNVDINTTDGAGETALHCAVMDGDLNVDALLQIPGVDMDVRAVDSSTPTSRAASRR